MDTKSRFLIKVRIQADGCWVFTSNIDRLGYGRFWFNGNSVVAHRVSWELFKKPIPKGMDVCHKCDVPACVNPEHLFVGTHLDNMRDMISKGRKRVASGLKHGSKTKPENILRGENHPRAKLTEMDVRAIRLDDRFQRLIAKDYGVSRANISYIKSGKLWPVKG